MDSAESAGRAETATFNDNIRKLFREKDRNLITRHFELWNHKDGRANSDKILGRRLAGTMRCDRALPSERVALFRRWVEGGLK